MPLIFLDIMPNDECIKNIEHLVVLISIILFFGFLGGIGRGALESVKDSVFKPKGFLQYIKYGFLGISGAGILVFIAILLSKYDGNKFLATDLLYFTSISISGGVLALSIVDAFAEKVKTDWLSLKDQVKGEVFSEILEYNKVITDADIAIDSNENETAAIQSVINRMEKMHKHYSGDYQFCVRLGILYRMLNRYDDAIRLLRQLVNFLISKKKLFFTDKRYVAVSYLNIACYHSLKMKNASNKEKDRLYNETKEALKEAVNYDKGIEESIETDPHLENYREYKNSIDNNT